MAHVDRKDGESSHKVEIIQLLKLKNQFKIFQDFSRCN